MPDPRLKAKLEQGVAAIQRASFPEAIGIFSELVAEEPESAEAWQNLGLCYLETRQLDLALEALTRAVKYDPHHALAHYLLGHAYGSTGQLEPAAACYRHALEIDPAHAKAEEFLMKTESLLESREHYRNALKSLYAPDPGVAELNLALRELMESAAIFADSPAHQNLRECAQKLFELHNPMTIPVRVTPDLELWARACERGYLCIEAKNWLGARAAYEEALGYRYLDGFVHHALGFSLAMLGETAPAVSAWLRLLELDSEYDFSRFGCLYRRE
ncbi:MAG TPA: tetratricopeptide repeat protein [Terriglobia bacterium]|nr:tetratricopeptide repeat protein [Terriglobia bacterium]